MPPFALQTIPRWLSLFTRIAAAQDRIEKSIVSVVEGAPLPDPTPGDELPSDNRAIEVPAAVQKRHVIFSVFGEGSVVPLPWRCRWYKAWWKWWGCPVCPGTNTPISVAGVLRTHTGSESMEGTSTTGLEDARTRLVKTLLNRLGVTN